MGIWKTDVCLNWRYGIIKITNPEDYAIHNKQILSHISTPDPNQDKLLQSGISFQLNVVECHIHFLQSFNFCPGLIITCKQNA